MLGHYDRPVIQPATLRYAADLLPRGRRPTGQQLARRAARYGAWRGLALWFSMCLVATRETAIIHTQTRAIPRVAPGSRR